MGYRELLKKYLCFVETHTGENFLDAIASCVDGSLTERDLAELRNLAAEMSRETRELPGSPAEPSCNHRLRLLCLCYSLPASEVAEMADVPVEVVHRWRTSPRSAHYLSMTMQEFGRFERRLIERRAETLGSGQ